MSWRGFLNWRRDLKGGSIPFDFIVVRKEARSWMTTVTDTLVFSRSDLLNRSTRHLQFISRIDNYLWLFLDQSFNHFFVLLSFAESLFLSLWRSFIAMLDVQWTKETRIYLLFASIICNRANSASTRSVITVMKKIWQMKARRRGRSRWRRWNWKNDLRRSNCGWLAVFHLTNPSKSEW